FVSGNDAAEPHRKFRVRKVDKALHTFPADCWRGPRVGETKNEDHRRGKQAKKSTPFDPTVPRAHDPLSAAVPAGGEQLESPAAIGVGAAAMGAAGGHV